MTDWTVTATGQPAADTSAYRDATVADLTVRGPRPWVDVRAYGASPSATPAVNDAAIAAAVAALPATGGDVLLPSDAPYKISATIELGNGTTTTRSTRNGIGLRGVGTGGWSLTAAALQEAATVLEWYGASGATMIRTNGPVGGVKLEGLMLDCCGIAATGLDAIHPFFSVFRNIHVVRHTGKAYRLTSRDVQLITGVGRGAEDNVWENVRNTNVSGASAEGIEIAGVDVAGSLRNPARNTFLNCSFARSDGGTSIILGFTDNLTFIGTFAYPPGAGVGVGLKVVVPTNYADFPKEITFINSPIGGGTLVEGATWTGTRGILFLPYPTGDSQAAPSHAIFSGVTTEGRWFGPIYGIPFQWGAGTGASNLATSGTEWYAAIGAAATRATESFAEVLFVVATDLKTFSALLSAAPGAGTSDIFTIRKNGADTAAVVTISDTDTTGSWSGTVSFAAGDRTTIQHTVSGTPAGTRQARFGLRLRETAA